MLAIIKRPPELTSLERSPPSLLSPASHQRLTGSIKIETERLILRPSEKQNLEDEMSLVGINLRQRN
ncbi:MAG: hypothetical protein SynsKO_38110 [Synoicihabitans sp.]